MAQVIRQRSATTQTCIDLFFSRLGNEDTLVTHDELEKATGKPKDVIRGSIDTARRRILHDHGKWFDCYRGIGYRVVIDEDMPDVGKRTRSRIRTATLRMSRILATADPTKQSAEAQWNTRVERSAADIILATTSQQSIAKVKQMVARTHNQLNLEEQAEAIRNALTRR
jgi:hypothetical protein